MQRVVRLAARVEGVGFHGLPRKGGLLPGIVVSAALLLAVANLFAQPAVTSNSAGALVLTNHFGDLNDDSTEDVRDLVAFTHHLTGTRSLSPTLTNRLDLDQDGAPNAADRAILANMIARRNIKAEEDFDGDELSNFEELKCGTNPFRPDTDGDGWLDGWEVAEGTNPLDVQSGLKLFVVARPPIQVLSPLIQDSDTNVMGTVVARPPVQVLSPLIQDSDTNVLGTVLARPPVTVTSPAN